MSDYCDICECNFGDPGYHGCGPSTEQWEKHYDHLFPVKVGLEAIRKLKEERRKSKSVAMSEVVELLKSMTMAEAAALVTEIEKTFGVSRNAPTIEKPKDRKVAQTINATSPRAISFDGDSE